jgi:hypothetical protein
MKMNILLLFLCSILCLNFFQTARADDNRTDKPFGLYLSSGSFTLFSINAAYNLNRVFRLSGGLGYSQLAGLTIQYPGYNATEILIGSDDIVVDINMKAMLPHLEFSPVVGLGLSNNTPLNPSNSVYLKDMLFPYVDAGFDYQAKDGFDFGLDIQMLISDIANAASLNTSYVIGQINVGKFF